MVLTLYRIERQHNPYKHRLQNTGMFLEYWKTVDLTYCVRICMGVCHKLPYNNNYRYHDLFVGNNERGMLLDECLHV